MSREDERTLSTADFASAAEVQQAREERDRLERDRMDRERSERLTRVDAATNVPVPGATQPEPLAELFPQDVSAGFRSRWDAVQIGFVDDPKQAVKQADEL